MTWKGPAIVPPPKPDRTDYIEVHPPRKTALQVAAERELKRRESWPFNVDITCPDCYLVFRLHPGSHDYRTLTRTCNTNIAYVRCPNCSPEDYSIEIEEPKPLSWWQRLFRKEKPR